MVKKLLIMCFGSRGDTQPFLALGRALQDHGYIVHISVNVENVDFAASMGLAATGVHFNMTELMSSPKMRRVMNSGSTEGLNTGIVNALHADYPAAFPKMLALVNDFKPDVLMPGLAFDYYTAKLIGTAKRIPVVYCPLSVQATLVPSSQIMTDASEPCCHFGLGILTWKILPLLVFNTFRKTAVPLLGSELEGKRLWGDKWRTSLEEYVSPDAIVLLQSSTHSKQLPTNLPASYTSRCRPTGHWVVSADLQLSKQGSSAGGADGPFLGGTSIEVIEAFLAAGSKPAYIGWGSMVANSPEHMAKLAVGALKKANLRGIVLGGFARLDASMVSGHPELKAYAEANVLWLQSAPHEWLFPQVCATVHHGGMGTTIAAMRSGVPTVITPMIFDQPENAKQVRDAGVGVGFRQSFKKVTVDQLGEALATAATDEGMKGAAAKLGEALKVEDGLAAACKAMDDFVRDDLDSGKWAVAFEATLAKRAKGVDPCPCWCARVCCSSTPFGPVGELEPIRTTPLVMLRA